MPSNVPYSLFTTEKYSENEKVEAYKESMGIVFDTKLPSPKSSYFKAQIHSFLISEIMLIECSTIEQYFERPRAKIAADGLDHIIVQLFIEGSTTRDTNEKQLSCAQGSIILIDMARPWKAFNKKFKNLSLVVPRRLLRGKIPNEDMLHGKILDLKNNPFASLLHSHILSLHENTKKITSEYAHSLVNPTVDMLCAAISYSPNECTSNYTQDKNVALFFRIKQYIEENLANPQLGVPLILLEFNLTKSTLYRLFPREAGGIMNYTKERRLVKAFRTLSIKSGGHKTISQISYESGFENESSFSRAFKQYFNLSPRDILNSPRSLGPFDPNAPDRVWENWVKVL